MFDVWCKAICLVDMPWTIEGCVCGLHRVSPQPMVERRMGASLLENDRSLASVDGPIVAAGSLNVRTREPAMLPAADDEELRVLRAEFKGGGNLEERRADALGLMPGESGGLSRTIKPKSCS
mmetsp:Transcript_118443/g.340102  ORF Transcript_118443/g.340102 Transcript_118443/m.340102 type:complete len:122 (-) Transcript_118443:284-649(-)